ncbi:MAG: LamG domain-containing protein, partial [Candidatus Paceibacterota bacterium]
SVDNALMSSKVSEWNFNNLSGTIDQDISSAANFVTDSWGSNHGTAVGTPDLKDGANCITGKCLSFNGSTDYVDLGSNTSLAMEDKDFTISAWVKLNSYGSGYCKAILGVSSGNGAAFSILTSSHVLYLSKTGVSGISGTTTIPLSNWVHVVVAFNSHSSTNNTTFYVNSVSDVETFDYDFSTGATTNNMGRYNTVESDRFFNGLIDDVRIYSAVIPTFQIQQNYYAGLNKLFAKRGIEISEYQNRLVELKSNYAQD